MKNLTALCLLLPALLLGGCDMAAYQDSVNDGKRAAQRSAERQLEMKLIYQDEADKRDDARWQQYGFQFTQALELFFMIGIPAFLSWACWYVFLKREAAIDHHKLENEEAQKKREDVIKLVSLAPANERVKLLESLGGQALLAPPR